MASFGTAIIVDEEQVYGSNFTPVVIPAFNGAAVVSEDENVYGSNYLSRVITQPFGAGSIQDLETRYMVTRSNPTG